jgi:hypothetical protein
MHDGIVISPDLKQVCELMNRIWEKPEWEFNELMLQDYIAFPGGKPDLTVGFKHQDSLLGYLAYIPYEILYKGTFRKVLLATWWTVNSKIIGTPIGLLLHKELFRIANHNHYDALLSIVNQGSHAERAFKAVMGRVAMNPCLVKHFYELIATPAMIRRRVQHQDSGNVRRYAPMDMRDCMEIAGNLSRKVDLCRLWSSEQMDYCFTKRVNTRTWVFEKENHVKAVINIYRKILITEKKYFVAVIEHALVQMIEYEEFLALWNGIMKDEIWREIDFLYLPSIGYYNSEWFIRIGFQPTQKQKNLYYVNMCNTKDTFTPIQSCYLDII